MTIFGSTGKHFNISDRLLIESRDGNKTTLVWNDDGMIDKIFMESFDGAFVIMEFDHAANQFLVNLNIPAQHYTETFPLDSILGGGGRLRFLRGHQGETEHKGPAILRANSLHPAGLYIHVKICGEYADPENLDVYAKRPSSGMIIDLPKTRVGEGIYKVSFTVVEEFYDDAEEMIESICDVLDEISQYMCPLVTYLGPNFCKETAKKIGFRAGPAAGLYFAASCKVVYKVSKTLCMPTAVFVLLQEEWR